MKTIVKFKKTDIPMIVEHFAAHHWLKPASTFEKYMQEQEEGARNVWLAFNETQFAGYVTLTKASLYPPFKNNDIPEIMDLNVLPPFRHQGIGSLLIETAENEAFKTSNCVGIGVGLYKDYGSAQKMYIARGYQPDGLGVTYHYQPVEPGKTVYVDDDLVLWFTKSLRRDLVHDLTTRLPSVIRSIKNATHFNWGERCDGWWLKEDSSFTVIAERMLPNTSEKKHYHKETEQFFYCLSGELLITIENRSYTLNAHDGLTVPAGKTHKVQNISLNTTTFLVISAPNAHEDRVELE